VCSPTFNVPRAVPLAPIVKIVTNALMFQGLLVFMVVEPMKFMPLVQRSVPVVPPHLTRGEKVIAVVPLSMLPHAVMRNVVPTATEFAGTV
jgi:hypothetical protein